MDGQPVLASEIGTDWPVWIWEHVKSIREKERPRGLIATARTLDAQEAEENKIHVRFSNVRFLPIPMLRERMTEIQNESEVVRSFIKATTRRVALLERDQASEFEAAVEGFINKRMLQMDKPIWASPFNEPSASAANTPWSDEELAVCILSYLEMLAKEQTGIAYSKTEYRRILQAGLLAERSPGSIEFRMQNISAFFEGMGLPRIEGYKPAKNIGSAVLERLMRIFETLNVNGSEDFQLTSDPETLGNRARNLQATGTRLHPAGNRNPQRKFTETSVFVRDPAIVAEVLNLAEGICECCNLPGPFQTSDGRMYLEVHHVRFLAQGGPDTLCNAVGVCPNCHRALHHSADFAELRMKLLRSIDRLKNH
jgi:5-methylcytosine-specific restriction protein A